MSCLRTNFVVYESIGVDFDKKAGSCSRVGVRSSSTLDFSDQISTLDFSDQNAIKHLTIKAPNLHPVIVQREPSTSTDRSGRWWEKCVLPNMMEVQSAQHLVEFLHNAGDSLVVLSFYSPGCGGCRTLHPKICQMAEMNPKTNFLKVNYEQHRAMCRALNVHVLPFFKFCRGAEGRLCSFSCTNATIKKFKDALLKHGTDRCSLGPAKGLDEEEMATLVSLGLISSEFVMNYGKEDGNLCVTGYD